MSLEAAIVKLTEVVDANSALLKMLTAKAKPAIEGDAPKKTKAKAAPAEDDEEEVKPRGRGRPKGSTKKVKTPSVAEMRKVATEFLEAAGEDEDEYAARKKKLKQIVGKFKADKFTEIDEEHRAEAVALLTAEDDEVDEDEGDEDDDI